jgi:hypothetical protein
MVDSSKPKLLKWLTPETMARIEGELAPPQESFTSIEDSYGQGRHIAARGSQTDYGGFCRVPEMRRFVTNLGEAAFDFLQTCGFVRKSAWMPREQRQFVTPLICSDFIGSCGVERAPG